MNIIDPIDLLTPRRFDIAFKYNLAYLMEKGIEDQWAFKPYEHHLKVWNNLEEKVPHKKGLQEFVDSFKETLSSIRDKGFCSKTSVIPVDEEDNYPLNGAHRIAASLLYNKKVAFEKIQPAARDQVGCDCTFYYLASRNDHVETGLKQGLADVAAHQYVKLKDNVRIATIFPAAEGYEHEIRDLINREVDVLYEKWFSMSQLAAFNFIRFAYDEDKDRGNPWLGDHSNGWSGAVSKTNHCFKGAGALRVYWFEEKSPEHTVALKEKIREVFNIGKHSVHINDTTTETRSMSGYLLNQNGLHFLHRAQPVNTPAFDYFLDKFKVWLESSGCDPEDFCVDSSAVLSAYGLRDCRDLDFLYHGEFIDTKSQEYSCHNEEMKYYQHKKSDIIFNPSNHFYYKGIKFANLNVIYEMKKFRNEEKDKRDCSLINNIF